MVGSLSVGAAVVGDEVGYREKKCIIRCCQKNVISLEIESCVETRNVNLLDLSDPPSDVLMELKLKPPWVNQ